MEESPTRYMLLPEEGSGAVDYSLNPHSPTKYPTSEKKKKKKSPAKNEKKTTKNSKGNTIHFLPKSA